MLSNVSPRHRRRQSISTLPTPSCGTPIAAGSSRCGEVNRIEIDLLRGIDRVRDILLDNTRRFAAGLPANNVLLWGARGTGKSSLVKAAHAAVNAERPHALALVEIHREDIPSLPQLLSLLRPAARRCLLFCDDLSFDQHDTSFKSLKAVLEGGIEGRPRMSSSTPPRTAAI